MLLAHVGAGQNIAIVTGWFWEPLLWGSSDVGEGEEGMAVSVDVLTQNLLIINFS